MKQLSGFACRQNPRLDALTRMCTAFSSFAELTDGTSSHYFPSLIPHGLKGVRDERAELADAYDAAMQARGDQRRAWRGIPATPHVDDAGTRWDVYGKVLGKLDMLTAEVPCCALFREGI
jgi:hypothetical protein